jgi:hypothetical protein
MRSDIDELISVMNRIIGNQTDGEIGEQDAAAAPAGGGGDGGGDKPLYPTITKWESGVTRGPANQIGLTKWSDIVKVTRGKANTLL